MKCVLCGKYIGLLDPRQMTERGSAHVNCFTALGGEDASDTLERISRQTEARRQREHELELLHTKQESEISLERFKRGDRLIKCWKCGQNNWVEQIVLNHKHQTQVFTNHNPGLDLSRLNNLPEGWHYKGWDCRRCSTRNFAVWVDAPPRCKHCKTVLAEDMVKCPNCGAPV